jgi:predicted KAP-like P-loop ATPase
MAVNNKWGTGKTTFIKMWKQLLMNEGFKTIYFNAWENDFQDDVIIALLAEIGNIKGTKSEVEYKSVLKKAKPLIGKAGLGLIKGLLKKIGADEMLQAIIDGTAEVTIDGIEKEIDNYTNRKKGIEGFREELEKLALSIGNDKPLIFIIDELDRCRPNYAVEVLEKIKHLYSVPGIVFILAIDKEQLSHAIKGVYGSDKIDANNYLRRFIDIEYTIPDPSLKPLLITYLVIIILRNSLTQKEIEVETLRTNSRILKMSIFHYLQIKFLR